MILVTGASGHIGREVCRLLRNSRCEVVAADLVPDQTPCTVQCDLTQRDEISRIFRTHPIQTVIHAAAILPTAFRSNPLAGTRVNLESSAQLLREAVQGHVRRFVFVSSMSVYGALPRDRAVTESDPAIPDEAYGGSKRAIELVGDALNRTDELEFISLRIARVIGPGATHTSSPWRSQIFDPPTSPDSISIPFSPKTALSLVHVEDVARMLGTLVSAVKVSHSIYNAPAEFWMAGELKAMIEKHTSLRVKLGNSEAAGPSCDGSRFAREFSFRMRGLEDRLSSPAE